MHFEFHRFDQTLRSTFFKTHNLKKSYFDKKVYVFVIMKLYSLELSFQIMININLYVESKINLL